MDFPPRFLVLFCLAFHPTGKTMLQSSWKEILPLVFIQEIFLHQMSLPLIQDVIYATLVCKIVPYLIILSSARLKNLKGNLHNSPESRYSVKHRNKNLSHTLDAFENTDGAKMNSSSRTTIQSEGRMDISDSLAGYSMGQVFGNLSVDIRSKRKGEKMAVNGSKSNRKKINSIPFVSDDLSNILQNNNCEFEGIATSSPYTDEVQDPRHQTVLRKVNAECSGDGSLQKSDVKHPLNCGNNMIQGGLKTRNNNSARSPILRHTKDLKNAVREGENNAKEESMCSKRDFIHSPESLSFGRSRSGRPLVPTLEFWRNQLPVYDSDRKMTGIKDELIVIGQSRGSILEPQKKRRQ
ncbi:hypothetical protein I3760_10G143000 [Carya illinoinensis]|nr:hypothetical protein I3760_10G143000 [Carya illinoinensis]